MTVTNKRIADEMSRCGGTAYPVKIELPEGGEMVCGGMTLRDWLAGQTLPSLVRCFGLVPGSKNQSDSLRELAELAYGYADAALSERSKSGGE